MKKQRNKVNEIIVKTGTISDFFESGRSLAKSIDTAEKLTCSKKIITFEDPKEMLKFLSKKKIELMQEIRGHPNSISRIARALRRERTAVYRDIKILEEYGLVETTMAPNRGHGLQKMVRPLSSTPIQITASI